MHDTARRKLLELLTVAPLIPLAGHLLAASSATAAPPSPRERIRRRYFPNVELQTQDGKTVRFYDDLIKNKIVTINFFYAKCDGICPAVTANLARVQRIFGDRVGREIFMNSISLKPEVDTPGVLKEYAEMFKA
jgi:protein SCO1/2